MYFSDELDGVGYNIGDRNMEIVIAKLFEGLDVQKHEYDKESKTLKVITNHRLEMHVLRQKRNSLTFKFKSGIQVKPYVMAELS